MPKTPSALVASGHQETTRIASAMLEQGGNAFDAAVAGGFASVVCEPTLTSLGGGGFLLAHTKEGNDTLFDFFVDTPGLGLPAMPEKLPFYPITVHFPSQDQIFNAGRASVATPGTLKGLLHVHRRLGKLPLKEVVSPTIELARHGVTLNRFQAYTMDLLLPIITLEDSGKALYAPAGKPLQPEELFKNSELADFLEALVQDDNDAANFYAGDLAATMERDMQQQDGLLTRADLKNYQVNERQPSTTSYRGYKVMTNPQPSFGGELLLLSLKLLEERDLQGVKWKSYDHAAAVAEIMRQTETLRDQGIVNIQEHRRHFSRGTTHISVADSEGNVATMSTSNGEGSGYVVPGTGIMLNNMLGEEDLHPQGFHADAPGARVASMMSPTLISDAANNIVLALGSGGSERIRSAILQVMSHTLDFCADVASAVKAPRLHWDGKRLHIEPGLAKEVTDKLAENWPVNLWNEHNVYFGGVHAIAPKTGSASGDFRRQGDSSSLG